MKKFNKKKIIILTATLFIYIPLVFAAISYSSSDVVVANTETKIPLYLQDAIDEIDHVCSTNCPNGYSCKTSIPKCIRASTLHTETCTNNDTMHYCLDDGYALNDTITYGNTATTTGALTTGDAFDCDVNGDGVYDSATERFYYISDYYDTERKAFNDKVAVLVYYSNTTAGVASTTYVAYDCNNQNYNGPVTAMQELPKTSQWTNIRLYKETRQILAQNNDTTANGVTLPTAFDYSGYSARLLTYQELDHGCYDHYTSITSNKGLNSNCKFLLERTKYTISSLATQGGWTETPSTGGVFFWDSYYRSIRNMSGTLGTLGARPTIEILKSEISY